MFYGGDGFLFFYVSSGVIIFKIVMFIFLNLVINNLLKWLNKNFIICNFF